MIIEDPKPFDLYSYLEERYMKERGDCVLCENKNARGVKDYKGFFICGGCWATGKAVEMGHSDYDPEIAIWEPEL